MEEYASLLDIFARVLVKTYNIFINLFLINTIPGKVNESVDRWSAFEEWGQRGQLFHQVKICRASRLNNKAYYSNNNSISNNIWRNQHWLENSCTGPTSEPTTTTWSYIICIYTSAYVHTYIKLCNYLVKTRTIIVHRSEDVILCARTK